MGLTRRYLPNDDLLDKPVSEVIDVISPNDGMYAGSAEQYFGVGFSAIRHAYYRENKALAIRHVRDIRFNGQIHNNKMERMNGEIRDREKVVRGIKKEDSPIIAGLQIYHNYVRSHMGLDGKTPSEVAGIIVNGQDKWLTLIQNAMRKQSNPNVGIH